MTNFKFSHSLLCAFLCLSVLFTSLLMLSHLVLASQINIPNSDVKYETWYQVPNTNHWEQFDNSVDGFIPNQTINVRLRFYFPTTQTQGQDNHYNISFTLLHNAASISLLTMNVLDQQGNLLSGDNVSWGAVRITNNATNLRTIINIEDFSCSSSSWVTLTFAYTTSSSAVQSNPSNGYIQITCSYFDMQQVSFESALNNYFNSLNSWLLDLKDSQDTNAQNIVDAVEDSESGILDGLVDLGSDLLGGIGSLGSDLLGGIGNVIDTVENTIEDLQDGILGGLSSLGSSILGALVDLGEFVVDGIYNLFVPDSDDLQDFLEDFKTDIEDENPMFGGVISIFTDLFETINTNHVQDSIHIPEFSFDVGNDTVSVGNWDMPLFPQFENAETILGYVRLFTSIVVGVWLLNMVFSHLLYTLGIGVGMEDDDS